MSSDKGTIRIPRDSFEDHNQRRKDLGVTWEDYIDGQAPEPEGVDVEELATQLEDALDTASMADDPGTRVGGELSETLREIREGLSTVEERTGWVERTLEDMGARR